MSDSPLPPFSVGKVQRSRMVFGDLVATDDTGVNQSTHSLMYSPSSEDRSASWYAESPLAVRFIDDGKTSISTIDAIDQDEIMKENVPEKATNDSLESSTIAVKPKEVVPIRKEPANQRSELRRALSEKSLAAQAAINAATESVNQTLNASRQSKKTSRIEVAKKTAKTHKSWKEENEEAKAFNAKAESSRRELLKMQRQLSSKVYRAKAKHQLDQQRARLDAIETESQFKSKVYRDHKRDLKEEQDRKRRASIATRAQLRKNHREGEARMRMKAIEEDKVLMEERHLSSVAWRESKKDLVEQRRKSFAFRNGDARRIRELHAEMEGDRKEAEHHSYELKWDGERDAEAYQKKLEQQKRDSLAFRNQEGRKQRKDERNRQLDELEAEHASYELKWAGERDAKAYEKQLADERRDSFAFRNQEGRRQREEEAKRRSEEQEAEHASYELNWDGERDAEAYKKHLDDERRKSLAFRNKQRAQHQTVLKELQQIAHEKETESLMLKWAGEEDAKAYLAKLEEERRQSLAFRNQEGVRHRALDADAHDMAVQAAHDEEELQAGCKRDVEQYKKDCAARDRASLAYRGKELQMKHAVEKKEKHEKMMIEEKNRALEGGARTDVRQYLDDCKKRRRMSLALRAKEKRKHAKWEKRQKELQREEKHRDTRDNAMDQKYVELASQRERARIAMDAIRHAGSSFSVNPFGPILE